MPKRIIMRGIPRVSNESDYYWNLPKCHGFFQHYKLFLFFRLDYYHHFDYYHLLPVSPRQFGSLLDNIQKV